MKIKSSLTFALLFVIIGTKAQVTIQFNGINEYAFNTAQAMNLTVINANSKAFEVQFSGKITSGNGSLVVEFKSNPVMLNPGANMLNSMNPGIHEQLYHNSDIAEIEAKTGTYPSGNYTICIWSACTIPDCQGAGQGSGSIETPVCTQVHIENPTPLLLASPGNGSEIEETRPLYTWIPPAPVAGSASLNYTMILVEMLEGQSISDALTLNRPLIDMMGIDNPMLMQPSDLAALEPDKSYAWQVQAYVGQTPIAKSEQWKFKVKKKEKVKDSAMYALVTKRLDAGVYYPSEDGYLYFIFHDYRPNSTLNYEILKPDMSTVKASLLKIRYNEDKSAEESTGDLHFMGPGKFKIDVGSMNLATGYYYLHIISSTKEHYYLKFYIR